MHDCRMGWAGAVNLLALEHPATSGTLKTGGRWEHKGSIVTITSPTMVVRPPVTFVREQDGYGSTLRDTKERDQAALDKKKVENDLANAAGLGTPAAKAKAKEKRKPVEEWMKDLIAGELYHVVDNKHGPKRPMWRVYKGHGAWGVGNSRKAEAELPQNKFSSWVVTDYTVTGLYGMEQPVDHAAQEQQRAQEFFNSYRLQQAQEEQARHANRQAEERQHAQMLAAQNSQQRNF